LRLGICDEFYITGLISEVDCWLISEVFWTLSVLSRLPQSTYFKILKNIENSRKITLDPMTFRKGDRKKISAIP